MLSLTDKNKNLKKYYGIYYKNPEKFKFIIGDKLLLQQLIEYVKDKPVRVVLPTWRAVDVPFFAVHRSRKYKLRIASDRWIMRFDR